MEEYLRIGGQWVGWAADAAGVIIIIVAIVRGVAEYGLQLIQRSTPLPRTRIRLNLARSLVLSLEFLLAADIVQTAIAPNWDDIGKLAAIVTIRTALNYFLGRDIEKEGREVQSDSRQESQQTGSHAATS